MEKGREKDRYRMKSWNNIFNHKYANSEETSAEIPWICSITQTGIIYEYQKEGCSRKEGNAFSAEETEDIASYSSSLLTGICD